LPALGLRILSLPSSGIVFILGAPSPKLPDTALPRDRSSGNDIASRISSDAPVSDVETRKSLTVGRSPGMVAPPVSSDQNVQHRKPIPVVDIFAGAGGLGDGFDAYGRGQERHGAFSVALSAEMDPHA